jgi:hypothetical protein
MRLFDSHFSVLIFMGILLWGFTFNFSSRARALFPYFLTGKKGKMLVTSYFRQHANKSALAASKQGEVAS